MNALDDPIVCEGTLLEPEEVVKAGEGKVMYVLTKRGGHVGYPIGSVRGTGWTWMTEMVEGFKDTVANIE